MTSQAASSNPSFNCYCLTVAYDGTQFGGWQRQPQVRTVQCELETALGTYLQEPVYVIGSGRTDAGVHALAQRVSFYTSRYIPPRGLCAGLRSYLPDDLTVLQAELMPLGFHARYDTRRKHYRYVIHCAPHPWPWLRNYVWWQRRPLDRQAMQQAAEYLLGTHDFRAFASQAHQYKNTVRTIDAATWSETTQWSPWCSEHGWQGERRDPASLLKPSECFLIFNISGDGFLYNMVRAIVGTLVQIGRQRWPPEYILQLLTRGERPQAGDNAPPQGLYLVSADLQLDPDILSRRWQRWQQRLMRSSG